MALSVFLAVGGIWFAYRNYVQQPEKSEQMATSFAGAHRLLTNKYYVDELYDATVVRGTMGSAGGLWTFDSRVVDGAVNGTGWTTIMGSWVSHVIDKYVVDGLVNLTAWIFGEASYVLRRVADGPDSELRVRHAGRGVRVHHLVSVRPVVRSRVQCHE